MTERCRVEEETNAHLNKLDRLYERETDIEIQEEKVRVKFKRIATTESFEDACAWLAGSFYMEAVANAADKAMDTDKANSYFDDLVRAKAIEIIEEGE